VELAALDAGDERVERQRLPGERGAVLAEALRGGTGHRDPQRLVADVLLGAGGGVDDDALAGAGGSDEDRGALGAGDDLQRVCLLAAEASADTLGDLVARGRASLVADVSAGAGGERGEGALDCLLSRTHRERRHQAALQWQDAAFGDHRPCPLERLVG
jgi:hypothetical protein